MKTYRRNEVKKSLMRSASRELGICEQLRIIYDSVYQLPENELKEKITEGLVDALMMAKKMGDRLTYYYIKTKDTSGHLGVELKKIPEFQSLAKIRSTRK